MSRSTQYGFDEEAALVKVQARRLLADRFPADILYRLVAANPGAKRDPACAWDGELWQQMVALGWHTLAVPIANGGAGMSHVAIAGLVEELGRAAVPCPLESTLAASFILCHCGPGGDAALAEIAAAKTASVAITDRDGSWWAGSSGIRYRGQILDGTTCFVQDARKADRLLVSAQGKDGLCLFWVATDAPGVNIIADDIVDLTRDQAHIRFDGVAAEFVCGDAEPALQQAFPAIWTMLAANIAGAAEWQLQTTVDYVSTRKQFDRPLGFFQAVKHPLVNVMLQIDQTRSLLYHAASTLDTAPSKAHQAAHMAKASASETAGFASSRSVQYHGGIGFTWECHLHVYFKRQLHSRVLWGDTSWHRARLADILMGPLAA